jgi:hypothetical protein
MVNDIYMSSFVLNDIYMNCKLHIHVINAMERRFHAYMDTVARRAAAKLQRHARVGTAFGYVTHDQLLDTHHHILSYSAPCVGCLDPHIMAHISTIN